MIIFPAIDIRNGKCVRLVKGDFNQETVFSERPEIMAKKWEDEMCIRDRANRAEKLKLNKSKSFWQKRRYALYIYYNHARLGAEKLNELGLNDIAEIIRYHHEKVDCKACGELQILCLADSLN